MILEREPLFERPCLLKCDLKLPVASALYQYVVEFAIPYEDTSMAGHMRIWQIGRKACGCCRQLYRVAAAAEMARPEERRCPVH